MKEIKTGNTTCSPNEEKSSSFYLVYWCEDYGEMSQIYLFDNVQKATLKLIELEEKEEEDYKQRGWRNTGGEFRMNEINIGEEFMK